MNNERQTFGEDVFAMMNDSRRIEISNPTGIVTLARIILSPDFSFFSSRISFFGSRFLFLPRHASQFHWVLFSYYLFFLIFNLPPFYTNSVNHTSLTLSMPCDKHWLILKTPSQPLITNGNCFPPIRKAFGGRIQNRPSGWL